ncbi:Proteasome subunit beta [Quillaja saponaria]|uniref:DNA-(apurinic or apyrimidinic site) lyase n=1 Tax=Quillaja saponaria TaxID=32244 RepID=A0AAD7PLK5_QUISA|nr:Proteasome subunit beta [Quillaja saponaria]
MQLHSLLPFQTMKRPRASRAPSLSKSIPLPPPSTPPTPQTRQETLRSKTTISTSYSSRKPKAILRPLKTSVQAQHVPLKWVPLNLGQGELSLQLTFPTGQSFRWKKTGPLQYTGVVGSHLISLKQLQEGEVFYCIHHTISEGNAREELLDFLNAGVSLADIWKVFSDSDARFAELSRHLGGVRVLRQDPLECLIQFLCSSNNNIKRITKMVDYISSLGNYLGTVEGFQFHTFPSLKQLSLISEEELRKAGFGYRAKYITGTVISLQAKPGGGAEWLESLRKLDLQEVIDALCTLPGVGPKVAACIALFSLDQHDAIPVDTHVWKIATRYLLPELAGSRSTPKLCTHVAEAFVSRYGKYAGWAQTLLFIAELPPQKSLLPSHIWTIGEHKLAMEDGGEAEAVSPSNSLKSEINQRKEEEEENQNLKHKSATMSIFEYNGSALVAMVGKNCLAIGSDRRLGVQLQTIATDFQRIFKIHDKLFIGLSGLGTDAQTLYQRLVFRHKLYQLREERDMKPESFASLVSAILYEKRFGPYFCQPVIAGLGDEDKPFICTMDSIGAKELAKDFVVAGSASESLYGACESMFKPDMEAEELFETISQALLSSVDRDCLSGWGGHVYVVTRTEVKERILKGRMD